MASSASTPPPRDIGDEFGGIADASGQIFDKALDFSQDYFNQTLANYPALARAERKATRDERIANMVDFQKLGPGVVDRILGFSPGYKAALDAINARLTDGRTAGPLMPALNQLGRSTIDTATAAGPSALRTELEQQALGDLQLGRFLNPEEQRAAEQSARQAYADRGLAYSPGAIGAEILNRDAYATNREALRRQFASGVHGLGMREDESLLNRRIGAGNLGVAIEGLNDRDRNYVFQALAANQGPVNAALGFFNQRAAVSPMDASNIMQGSSGLIQGFAPLLNYGSDLYNTNFNAQAATSLANAKARNDLTGAGIEAVGSIIGGAAKGGAFCWAAREVFKGEKTELPAGEEVPTWKVFRHWMLTEGPPELVESYGRNGEKLADYLKEHPDAAKALRPLFADIVESHVNEEAA